MLNQLGFLLPAVCGFTGLSMKRLGKPGILLNGAYALGPALGVARQSGLLEDPLMGTPRQYKYHS